jgi:hypothetical protein
MISDRRYLLPTNSGAPSHEASTDAETNRQLHEVLDELVPTSMRGKKLRSMHKWGYLQYSRLNMRT